MPFVANLAGDEWAQHSNHAGQIYYIQISTNKDQFEIPTGWEDLPQDTWVYQPAYQHWRNSRTGRIVFQNPNPLPAQTYLDKTSVIAHLQTIERTPASSEAIYRRATTSILRWLFKEEDGYDVVQEDNRESSVPDHVVFKIERRAGSSFYAYDFLMVECKRADYSWDVALEHCTRHCENTDNESKKVYAMIQIGLTLQFYKWVDSTLTTLTNKLHVRLDVDEIIAAAEYLRTHPLPVVNH